MIYKMFTGNHIDLSKVVDISAPWFEDRMGRGGYYAGFDITFQLMDNPVSYGFDVSGPNSVLGEVELPEGVEYAGFECSEVYNKAAMEWLTPLVDEVIAQWRASKGEG